ncbi:MAG: Unknown protein [uncultured Sulfurovum sp.]|uniref:Copper resistance protein D domain-containing protein n=1 Tax=uncultured Sulfurovum sp. TaxID=269237 RepID=A0A6S6S7G0_9BACT|nr:MAG: Unknown protein [uncultured Sulfurovum sp.]
MGWGIHLHLIAAISWIGGAVFMFVLGISLRNKEDQDLVYPRIGPIFGYFEIVVLILLISTGIWMIVENNMIYVLFNFDAHSQVIDALREKLVLVAIMTVITIIHLRIAFRTNGKERTRLETLLSRGSSLGIFVLNFIVLHYAIVLRDIL